LEIDANGVGEFTKYEEGNEKSNILIFIVSVSIIPEIKTQNNGYFFPILR